jgi:hypothetical protein
MGRLSDESTPVLRPGRFGSGMYNWPDGSIAIWRLVTQPGKWAAAPRDGTFVGEIFDSAEEAARSVGATIEEVR